MAVIWIPSLLRDLTAGRERVHCEGATVRDVIENLELSYHGVRARLIDAVGGQIQPNIAVVVDGEVSLLGLLERVSETSEVHFIPAIAGGA